jgi:hypothetical protein
VADSRMEAYRDAAISMRDGQFGVALGVQGEDEVLDQVFDTFRPIIPYNRIGFSFLEDEGSLVRLLGAV